MARHFALVLYDHLGQAVLLNLVWLLASLPWFAAAAVAAWLAAAAGQALGHPAIGLTGAAAGIALVAWSPPTFFVVERTRGWLAGDEGDTRAAWRQTRRQMVRVQGVGVTTALLVVVLLGNGIFYQAWGGWSGLALCGVMLWLVVGVALVGLCLLPLLAAHPQTPVRRLVVDAALLVLAHPGAALGQLLVVAVGVGVGALSGVGLALGGVPALALSGNLWLRVQLARHGGAALERDPRGWRDLLRPWQT